MENNSSATPQTQQPSPVQNGGVNPSVPEQNIQTPPKKRNNTWILLIMAPFILLLLWFIYNVILGFFGM